MTKEEKELLNKIPYWKDKCCVDCGRKYPETILNVEAVIHHRAKLRCYDRKKCEKRKA